MSSPCPKCGFTAEADQSECPRCGIVFEHYTERPGSTLRASTSADLWREVLFPELDDVNPLYVVGRLLVWCGLVWLGMRFVTSSLDGLYSGSSFLHLVNLPFHEAGHVIFRPFGRIITSLGGSLGQLLVPLICLVALLVKTRDAFGAAVCLWWFGQSWIDLAPYINDARSLTLPLLGGNVGSEAPYGFHDWEFILKELGLARFDHVLARCAHSFGSTLIVLALIWGAVELWRQYREVRTM